MNVCSSWFIIPYFQSQLYLQLHTTIFKKDPVFRRLVCERTPGTESELAEERNETGFKKILGYLGDKVNF